MYKCPFCGQQLSRFFVLKQHINIMHYTDTVCPICGEKVSPRNGALRGHAVMKWITADSVPHLYLAIAMGSRSEHIPKYSILGAKKWFMI